MLLARHITRNLATQGFTVGLLNIRDLPAEDLLGARADAPKIAEAVRLVQQAQGIIVATPVYKAAYSGVLKTFLDLLPQLGLAGKSVLPIVTGGSSAHVLAIDYALRPVLSALGARHVTSGQFFLDQHLERLAGGGLHIDPQAEQRFVPVLRDFVTSVRLHGAAQARAVRR